MYKTLLVPLNGSKRAEAILPFVEEMVHRFEAKVVLLQVVESHPVVISPVAEPLELNSEGLRQHINEADAYLTNLQGELREKKIMTRHFVEHGPIIETIIDVAAREGADMIAMASHGRSGLSQVFYGSVAAGVLQRLDRPILLVRSRNNGR